MDGWANGKLRQKDAPTDERIEEMLADAVFDDVPIVRARSTQAPWLDPQRGRKRPHRPRLDELDRR